MDGELTGIQANLTRGRWAVREDRRRGVPRLWFTAGCALHSLIDIFPHHDDGPLLFFPFDWSFRFEGPISYWHPEYYGHIFFPLEMGLSVLILAYFAARWWRRRRRGAVQRKRNLAAGPRPSQG